MYEEETFFEENQDGVIQEEDDTLPDQEIADDTLPKAQPDDQDEDIDNDEDEELQVDDDEEEIEEEDEGEVELEDNDVENEEEAEETFEETLETLVENDENEEADTRQKSKRLRIAVRKPPSKWILFLGEQRKNVTDANPDLAMGEVTKVVANMYKELSESELQRLDTLVEEKKRAYEEAVAHNQLIDAEEGITGGSSSRPTSKGSEMPGRGKLLLPLARIKRIIKLDEEVKNVSKESVSAITKATELFIARLAVKAASTTRLRGGRTVNMNDLLHTIHSVRAFEFLDMDFPKPATNDHKSAASKRASTAATSSSATSKSSSDQHKKKTIDPTAANNGKYSMLNFISGTKRSSADDDHNNEDGEEAEYVAVQEDEGGEDGIKEGDDQIEDLEEVPTNKYKSTSPSSSNVPGIPSHLEW